MGRRRGWTDEELIAATRTATSIADVARLLGLNLGGGTHQHLRMHIKRLRLDLPRYDARAWMRRPGANTGGRRQPLDEVLVADSSRVNVGKLRLRLIAEGLKPARCEECGSAEWLDRPLPLQLHHVDGDRTNNRIENLRILCPNCHALTDTWCRRSSPPA